LPSVLGEAQKRPTSTIEKRLESLASSREFPLCDDPARAPAPDACVVYESAVRDV